MCFKVGFILIVFITAVTGKDIKIFNVNKYKLTVTIGEDKITLQPYKSVTQAVEDNWSGTITAVRNNCNRECDGPKSSAKFTLRVDDLDSYGVSLVDGYNVPIKIIPMQVLNCKPVGCKIDTIRFCPEMRTFVNDAGEIVACKHTPLMFKKLCPETVLIANDETKMLTCQTDLYWVYLG